MPNRLRDRKRNRFRPPTGDNPVDRTVRVGPPGDNFTACHVALVGEIATRSLIFRSRHGKIIIVRPDGRFKRYCLRARGFHSCVFAERTRAKKMREIDAPPW